ncbi:MAG TPA: BatD family protein, partial [Thermoanaerobaculia bacterium]|nr:BatD family protein [Thermoanaerobaculia bacterium]
GATLTVTLAGAGHLQGVAPPRLDLPPGLTVFPPQQQSEDHVNGATVEGRRTWTYVIVPNRPGLYSVKPQALSYYDPAHHGYRLAESPALTLAALPAPPAAPASGAAAGQAAGTGGAGGTAARPERGAGLRDGGPFAWLSPPGGWSGALAWQSPHRGWAGLLPWLLLSMCIVLAAVLVRRRGQASTATSAGAPGAAGSAGAVAGSAGAVAGSAGVASGVAGRGAPPPQPREVEQKLREAAREDRPRHAAALVEEGWRGYLAGRWGLPSTTPPARWGAVLAAQGVTSDVADEVTRLVEELHYLRYAPQLSTTGAIRDQLLSRSRQLLRRLR